MEGKTLILLLNSRVIHAYLYTFSNVQIYSGQNRTSELYLSVFRGTESFAVLQFSFVLQLW